MTRSISLVRTRAAAPVAAHIEAIRRLIRASDEGCQARQDAVDRGSRDGVRLRDQVDKGSEGCRYRDRRRHAHALDGVDGPSEVLQGGCKASRAEPAPKMASSR